MSQVLSQQYIVRLTPFFVRDGTTIFVTSIEKYNSELGVVFHCQKTPATVECQHSCKVVTEYVMNLHIDKV